MIVIPQKMLSLKLWLNLLESTVLIVEVSFNYVYRQVTHVLHTFFQRPAGSEPDTAA
jgi:hypothetical protein